MSRSPRDSVHVFRSVLTYKADMQPSVGRIVHFYVSGDTTPQAALVIAVWSDTCVNLQVCNSGGTWSMKSSVSLNEDANVMADRWVWPPRA